MKGITLADQLDLKVTAFRKNGKWYIKLAAPRWFIDEMDQPGVTFNKASSSFLGGGNDFTEASILLTVNPPQVEPDSPRGE
jgi:hypothetical protein